MISFLTPNTCIIKTVQRAGENIYSLERIFYNTGRNIPHHAGLGLHGLHNWLATNVSLFFSY